MSLVSSNPCMAGGCAAAERSVAVHGAGLRVFEMILDDLIMYIPIGAHHPSQFLSPYYRGCSKLMTHTALR